MALDIIKLTRILGMMGSSHDGEVLNAARMASEMLRAEKLIWRDVIKKPPFDRKANHRRYMKVWRDRKRAQKQRS